MDMLLKCPSCQADNQPDSRFCSRCATPLPQEAPSDSDGLTRTMIASIDRLGHEVLVGLRVGATSLRARITPAAARELELALGRPVVALVKTSAIHRLDGDPK